MRQYLDVVGRVLATGTRKPNRTGVDTLSAFNINYQVDLRQGFPLLTTKKISWKNIVIENLWFLSGRPDIGLLHKHGCRFWDAWADDDGMVPSAYGNFWRNFPAPDDNDPGRMRPNDQLAWVLAELRRNPASRRLVVSAWAPGNAQPSTLPPCHAFWMLNVQYDNDGEPMLCLHLTQRSCDVALGLPYNIAGYALLLELFAQFSGMRAGIMGHTLVDAHVYVDNEEGSRWNHLPNLREQLKRTPKPLPRLELDKNLRCLDDVLALFEADTDEVLPHFRIRDYDPEPAIQFKVAV